MSELIGIGGMKGVGKNTAALALREYGFKELSFAHPLKQACAQAFELSYDLLDNPKTKDERFKRPISLTVYNLVALLRALSGCHEFTREEKSAVFANGALRTVTTPRQLLQFVGSDLIRKHVSDDFWCQAMCKQLDGHSKAVITDMRLPNEREFIKSLGGKCVLVKRPGSRIDDQHVSETSTGTDSEYDFVVVNDDSIASLHSRLISWYKP